MKLCFLLTNPFQLFHYERIGKWLPPSSVLIEVREQDFGVEADAVKQALPGWEIDWISTKKLKSLDGRFDVVLCQTPVLPYNFFENSLVIAQQYSLAKESYQYGIWRSVVDLNLMYGEYSYQKVSGFSVAEKVGNPLLDPLFSDGKLPSARSGLQARQLKILLLPTYGDLSSLQHTLERLKDIDASITLKPHHMEAANFYEELPDNVKLTKSDVDPVLLLTSHDIVITDYSGAAYDAAFARVPLILTGSADPNLKDYHRLSKSDIERENLLQVAEQWSEEKDFQETVERAFAKTTDQNRYEALLAEYLVNLGTAGKACAESIQRSAVEGRRHCQVALMVRESLEKHIKANRVLRGKIKRQSSKKKQSWTISDQVKNRLKHIGWLKDAWGRAQKVKQRAVTLKRIVAGNRTSTNSELNAGDGYTHPLADELLRQGKPPGPRELRTVVADYICRELTKGQVFWAVSEQEYEGAVAVSQKDQKALFDALEKINEEFGGLKLVTYRTPAAKGGPRDFQKMSRADFFAAIRVDVGFPFNQEKFYVGQAGYATILLVGYDEDRKRFLALDTRAPKVDWTGNFAAPDSAGGGVVKMTKPITLPGLSCKETRNYGTVDLVYTWVDASDPRWREKYTRFSGQAATLISADNEERYQDREELRFSLRSVELFAPFVNKIYIVTDEQVPSWLNVEHPQIRVVDHKAIFPDPAILPVFNSHAIEACIHRIDGLAENYLYMNDDFIFGNEVTVEDFYTSTGMVKAHLSPSQFIYRGEPAPEAIPTDWAAYNASLIIRDLFGYSIERKIKHVPYAQKRSLMFEIEERCRKEINRTRKARFRSRTDIAFPSMFSFYYAIATNRGVEWPNVPGEYAYADTGRKDWFARTRAILKKRPKYICFNTTRHEEISLDEQAENLKFFLNAFLPFKSKFEKE